MARRGSREARNAGHKTRRAQLWAAAVTPEQQLAAAYEWFRSSAALLARRRVPLHADQKRHRDTAARLMREMAAYLKARAEEIDRGVFDVKAVTYRDNG